MRLTTDDSASRAFAPARLTQTIEALADAQQPDTEADRRHAQAALLNDTRSRPARMSKEQ